LHPTYDTTILTLQRLRRRPLPSLQHLVPLLAPPWLPTAPTGLRQRRALRHLRLRRRR
jgi:hypothetical protein